MRIKGDYVLDTVGGEKLAVPLESGRGGQAEIVKLNGAGSILWEKLQESATEDELVQALTDVYEVDGARAAQDVARFLAKLEAQGILER